MMPSELMSCSWVRLLRRVAELFSSPLPMEMLVRSSSWTARISVMTVELLASPLGARAEPVTYRAVCRLGRGEQVTRSMELSFLDRKTLLCMVILPPSAT